MIIDEAFRLLHRILQFDAREVLRLDAAIRMLGQEHARLGQEFGQRDVEGHFDDARLSAESMQKLPE